MIARCADWLQEYAKLDVRYFVRNGLWVSLRFVIISLLGALVTVSFARFGTAELLGQYQFVISLLALISFVALPGFSIALLDAHAKENYGALVKATRISFFASLVGVPVIFLFGLYKFFVDMETVLGTAMIAAAFLFPVYYTFVNKWYTYYEHQGAFSLIAKRFILAHSVVSAMLIGAIVLSAPLIILVAIFFCGYSGFHFFYYRRTLKALPSQKKKDFDVRYGLLISVQKIFYTSTVYIPPFAIGILYGYENLAQFHIAFFFVGTFALFFASLSMLYMPLLFKYAKVMVKQSVIQNIVIGIIGAGLLTLCVKLFFLLLFGSTYESVFGLALAFCGIATIVPLRYFLVNYYTARKKNTLVIGAYATANIFAVLVFFFLRNEDFLWSTMIYLYTLHFLILLPLIGHYAWHVLCRKSLS